MSDFFSWNENERPKAEPEQESTEARPASAAARPWLAVARSVEPPAAEEAPLPDPVVAEPAGAARRPQERPAGSHAAGREPSSALTPERLLKNRRSVPESGWRRAVYKASGGRMNPGDSARVQRRQELERRTATRLAGSTGFVAVFARKGGVGKTTTTTLLGMTLASLRHDRVCAIDGNPDRGTLTDRVERQSAATVFDVASGVETVRTFADMSRLVSRDKSRLDVIASETDPHEARAFLASDYDQAAQLLSQHYSIVLTDTGIDFTHEVQRAILARADAVVVVAGGAVDEATLASETLDTIEALGFPELAANAVVAIQSASQTPVKVEELHKHFDSRARAVVRIPRDQHLAEGSHLDLERLAPGTRLAVLELAAHVVDGLAEAVSKKH